MARTKKATKTGKKVTKRVFVLKKDSGILIYVTGAKEVKAQPTYYRLTGDGRELYSEAVLCSTAIEAIPAFKALKEGEIAEITGLDVTSLATLEDGAELE